MIPEIHTNNYTDRGCYICCLVGTLAISAITFSELHRTDANAGAYVALSLASVIMSSFFIYKISNDNDNELTQPMLHELRRQ